MTAERLQEQIAARLQLDPGASIGLQCQQQHVPGGMDVATIKQVLWARSGDVELRYFRLLS